MRTMRIAALLGLIAMVAAPAAADDYLIYGGNSGRVFLGCLTCSKYDSDSVHNQYGSYGSPYNFESIFNRYGDHGSKYSNYSVCNPYANDPPVVVDRQGNYYGRLTVNRYSDPVKDASIQGWVAGICAGR